MIVASNEHVVPVCTRIRRHYPRVDSSFRLVTRAVDIDEFEFEYDDEEDEAIILV